MKIKMLMMKETVFIYRWYDKDTDRYHSVMFNDRGKFAGGYSYKKDEDDPGVFLKTCAEVHWEDGVFIVEKSLEEDEKENKKETCSIPKNWIDDEN